MLENCIYMYISLKNIILDYYYSLQIYSNYKFVIDAYDKNIEFNIDLIVKNNNIILGQLRHNKSSSFVISVNHTRSNIENLFVRQLVNIPKIGSEESMYLRTANLPKRYWYTWPRLDDLKNYLYYKQV